jgi:2-methylcitrate dehydratase PrpD
MAPVNRSLYARQMDQLSFTRALGSWISQVPEAWGAPGQEAAGRAVMDTVACMIAGSAHDSSRAVRRACLNLGDGSSTLVGSARKLSAPWAALVNGTAAHALDFDDNHDPSKSHASAVLVPALFALGDQQDSGGAALLDAYVVGIEVLTRTGQGLNPYHRSRGWHGTATVGTIGAAGACARLMRLDADQAANAISLAASFAGGTMAQFGTLAKPVHAGKAAQAGVLCALLAASGLEAAAEAFEGPYGLGQLMVGPDADELRDGLSDAAEHGQDMRFDLDGIEGQPALLRYGLKVKRFPCCGSTHRAIDGLLELLAAHGFGAEDVERIEVHAPAAHLRNLPYTDPENPQQARFSLEYCLAVALLTGNVSLGDFTSEAVRRDDVRAKLGLTRRHPVEKLESEFPTLVRVRLGSGQVHEARVEMPVGSIARPLGRKEMAAKALDCCLQSLVLEKSEALVAVLSRFGESSVRVRGVSGFFPEAEGGD